jgi:hypothetical protein
MATGPGTERRGFFFTDDLAPFKILIIPQSAVLRIAIEALPDYNLRD